MSKLYFLKPKRSGVNHHYYTVTDRKGNCQEICFHMEEPSISFPLPHTSLYSELHENRENLKKIISSRVETDNSNPSPLPIAFPLRSIVHPEIPEGITNIYCDGSLSENCTGGWAFARIRDHETYTKSGRESCSDSCRMELLAAVMGIESSGENEITVNTDSRYVKHGVEIWLPVWELNGYITASNSQAKNRDLWEKMSELLKNKKVYWKWVKSGGGNRHHDLCHRLAREQALSVK